MKIIFMGSPEFSTKALEFLHYTNHEIVCVYTQSPKKSGRGNKHQLTPVHEMANHFNLPVRTPKNFKDVKDQQDFINLDADVVVVSAYGLLLPTPILRGTKHGCLNIHPSLLPKYRGCSPIQRAIENGDEETGVCIMKLDEGMDTGDILAMQRIPIWDKVYYRNLHDILASNGARLLSSALTDIENILPQKQSLEGISYSKKITKEELKIDWNLPIKNIYNKIRAFEHMYFTINDIQIKIIDTEYEEVEHNYKNGEIINNDLDIACDGGILKPIWIQRSGKNAMDVRSYLNGNKIPIGTLLN